MSHQVVADPRGVDLDVSRYSQSSNASSSVTLGGESYPIGSKVGTSGLFVIGDPHQGFGAPKGTSSTRTSQTTLNQTGSGNYLISEKYYFEEWNWQVIRFSCLGVLLAIMIGLLAAVIGLAFQGKAACTLNLEWYQGSVIYHINVPEFYNSDNDNIGDLKGIQERVDYLRYLRVKTVCLSKVLPTVRPGYEEITSFRDVDSRIGTKQDIQALASTLHSRGMYLMIEMSPVWTSDLHEWFQESRKQSYSGTNYFKDFYIWRTSRPGNEDSMWKHDPLRNQYFKHLNNSERPILNWDSAKVAEELQNDLEEWLNLGVDGFYVRGLEKFYLGPSKLQYGAMHGYLQGWHNLLKGFKTYRGDRVIMLDGSYLREVQKHQPTLVGPMLNFVNLVSEPLDLSSKNLTYSLQAQVNFAMESWQSWPNTWVSMYLGPFTSIVDQSLLPALQTFLLMLPGTPAILAGHEVGKDPLDPTYKGTRIRPLGWTNPGSGETPKPFETGSKLDVRNINQIRNVILLRSEEPALRADYDGHNKPGEKNIGLIFEVDTNVLFIKRFFFKRTSYFYAMNLGKETQVRDWSSVSSLGFFHSETSGQEGDVYLRMTAVEIQPKQGIIFYIPV